MNISRRGLFSLLTGSVIAAKASAAVGMSGSPIQSAYIPSVNSLHYAARLRRLGWRNWKSTHGEVLFTVYGKSGYLTSSVSEILISPERDSRLQLMHSAEDLAAFCGGPREYRSLLLDTSLRIRSKQ